MTTLCLLTAYGEWLKVLRKKNVSVIFATQSLADIANSPIAPAIIESCLSRIFLPNNRAMEPQQREAYDRFGLNKRQVQIIASATPKRDYYFQSHGGNRLFDLQLGPVALAFCAAGSEKDHADLDHVMDANGTGKSSGDFAANWLRFKGLDWAADLMATEFSPDNEEEYVPWLDAAE